MPSKIKIKESSLKGNKISLLFNQKVKNINFQLTPKTEILLVDKINTDSLEIYLKEKKDSINIILSAAGYQDTILLKKEKDKNKSFLKLDINNYQNPANTIYINSLLPLTILNNDSIYLKTDSLKYIKLNAKLSTNTKEIMIKCPIAFIQTVLEIFPGITINTPQTMLIIVYFFNDILDIFLSSISIKPPVIAALITIATNNEAPNTQDKVIGK